MATKVKDKYDRAIAYLRQYPDNIPDAWYHPGEDTPPVIAMAHCLFQYATPTGEPDRDYGCITQVAHGSSLAWTQELTQQIRADRKIPRSWLIKPRHLPTFARWQRKLDRVLRSKKSKAQ